MAIYSSDELQKGTKLDKYIVQSVLGRGAFGITYLAVEELLDRPVAIKEYLPSGFAKRDQESTVYPLTKDDRELFQYGLSSFLDEAKTIVRFKHPNILRVLTFFEKNNTAYIVMEYEVGQDLKDYLKTHSIPSEARLLEIFCPINEGLANIHKLGYIHRDIKPGNIYIRKDDSPVLLDFGAARNIFQNRSNQLTRVLTPGYAPYEQDNPEWEKQGPWTDIYALGATLYFAITGERIVSSQERANAFFIHKVADPYKPLAERFKGQYSDHFLKAIDDALKFHPSERPQDVLTWNDELLGRTAVQEDKTTLLLPENSLYVQETIIQREDEHLKQMYQSENIIHTDHTILPQDTKATENEKSIKSNILSKNLFVAVTLIMGISLLGGGIYYFSHPTPATSTPQQSSQQSQTQQQPQVPVSNTEPVSTSNLNMELITANVNSALLYAKVAGERYLNSLFKQKLINDYESLPATTDRTKYIANLKIQANSFKQGFDANFKQYADSLKTIQSYPKKNVEQAVITLIDTQYKNDLTYKALGELLIQHATSGNVSEDVWRQDLETLSQKPGVFFH